MKPGTVLRPVGKFFSIRVTSCRFDLRTIRIEGDHLRADMTDTGTKMAMNLVKLGSEYVQVSPEGVHNSFSMSRFSAIKPNQLELFEL
jgi:hypothetical protein